MPVVFVVVVVSEVNKRVPRGRSSARRRGGGGRGRGGAGSLDIFGRNRIKNITGGREELNLVGSAVFVEAANLRRQELRVLFGFAVARVRVRVIVRRR